MATQFRVGKPNRSTMRYYGSRLAIEVTTLKKPSAKWTFVCHTSRVAWLPVLSLFFLAGYESVARSADDAETALTHVKVRNAGRMPLENASFTFGQLFKPGDIPPGSSVQARLASGAQLPLQVDAKATHSDGSLRHAVLTALLPKMGVGDTATIVLEKSKRTDAEGSVDPKALLAKNFSAQVSLDVEGKPYSVSVQELLKQTKPQVWLSGPLVTEWHFAAPIKDADGVPHPHLALRCAVRVYRGLESVRLDFAIENNWAYVPAPRNYGYDARFKSGTQINYEKTGLIHPRGTRWRKLLWWGKPLDIQALPDTRDLIATGALPSYNLNQKIVPSVVAALENKPTSPSFEPLRGGLALPYMPTTGGRSDIGPLPAWAALLLISQDLRALETTLAMGNLGGSWPVHYRDEKTGLPVSLLDYPYMTLRGEDSDTVNPHTKRSEKFPNCGGDCKTPMAPDSSHQPSFAYLPYVLSGDYYYLEELQFWATWNMLQFPPSYRELGKGLFKSDQVRGQAWSLRTLAQAAYITPDDHPLKQYFSERVNNNLNWYNEHFSHNPAANALGVLTSGYAFSYQDGRGIAPWQDDFFTWATGYVYALGFSAAKPILQWKAKFPVARMIAPGSCWIFAAPYELAVRESKNSKALYATWEEIYRENQGAKKNSSGTLLSSLACGSKEMAQWMTLKRRESSPGATPIAPGEMVGYSTSAEGYPANMQPALAAAVDAESPGAGAAWEKFAQRPLPTDFSAAPQFAVVPRKIAKKPQP